MCRLSLMFLWSRHLLLFLLSVYDVVTLQHSHASPPTTRPPSSTSEVALSTYYTEATPTSMLGSSPSTMPGSRPTMTVSTPTMPGSRPTPGSTFILPESTPTMPGTIVCGPALNCSVVCNTSSSGICNDSCGAEDGGSDSMGPETCCCVCLSNKAYFR